jgi:hypothetical protein
VLFRSGGSMKKLLEKIRQAVDNNTYHPCRSNPR